jgi:SAM-dependent methyltransferase
MTAVEQLREYVARVHPRSAQGLVEAEAEDPILFATVTESMLQWAIAARGPGAIEACADAYVTFSHEVNLAQARYERSGRYPAASHAEQLDGLYATERMRDYLWGVFLTNVLWPHHLRLLRLYRREFVDVLPAGARVVELASGHGGWGVLALTQRADIRVDGWDISPAALTIATAVAAGAGVSERARHAQGDALTLDADPPYDAAICCFLLEHLDEPAALWEALARVVRPGGQAFVTAALTAAQEDHVYEIVHESELVAMAERAGFRVRIGQSEAPPRTLPKARFVPRSMALCLQRNGRGSG